MAPFVASAVVADVQQKIDPCLVQLTRLQQAYVLNLIADPEGNQTRAYLAAGFKSRGEAATINAAKCLRNPKVRAAYECLRAQLLESQKSKAIADATERRELLSTMLRDAAAHPIARLKSVDILNKMDGLYTLKFGAAGPDGKTLGPRRVIIELDDAQPTAQPAGGA